MDEPEESNGAPSNGVPLITAELDQDSGVDACQDLVFDLLSQINRGSISR